MLARSLMKKRARKMSRGRSNYSRTSNKKAVILTDHEIKLNAGSAKIHPIAPPNDKSIDKSIDYPSNLLLEQETELVTLKVKSDMSSYSKEISKVDPQLEPHSKRSVANMPRPDLCPQASANRKKKPANLRLYDDFLKKVDLAAKESGLTRTAWLEEAIEEKLSRHRNNTLQ